MPQISLKRRGVSDEAFYYEDQSINVRRKGGHVFVDTPAG